MWSAMPYWDMKSPFGGSGAVSEELEQSHLRPELLVQKQRLGDQVVIYYHQYY